MVKFLLFIIRCEIFNDIKDCAGAMFRDFIDCESWRERVSVLHLSRFGRPRQRSDVANVQCCDFRIWHLDIWYGWDYFDNIGKARL